MAKKRSFKLKQENSHALLPKITEDVNKTDLNVLVTISVQQACIFKTTRVKNLEASTPAGVY